MTVPPLRKWRPCTGFYRSEGIGWQFFLHPHPDHNPIVVVSYWKRAWHVQLHRLTYNSGHGFEWHQKFPF
jgi:hypothetical protein